MAYKIVVTINHQLEVELIRKRVEARLNLLRQDYLKKIAHYDFFWSGNVAIIQVEALGYSVLAQIFLTERQVRVEVSLPWILTGFSKKIENLIMKNARDALGKN